MRTAPVRNFFPDAVAPRDSSQPLISRQDRSGAVAGKHILAGKHRSPDAADVLRAFNTWSFKREQPDNAETMLAAIEDAIGRNAPVEFVLYWGKGPRANLASPDIQCLDYIASMGARISSQHGPGARFTLIMTDTHARLNGHEDSSIQSYFTDIARVARARGFAHCFLADLVGRHATPVFPTEEPGGELMAMLAACARKWYRGPDAAEDGARRYFRMNMIERRAVGAAFPGSIFITFNGGDVRALLPDTLPVFYMYSTRRGFAEKPWFMSGDAILDWTTR